MQQIRNAKTYFAVSRGLEKLLETDLGIFNEAPTFFGMTIASSVAITEITIARLYDRSENTVTIWSLLAQAKREIGSFKGGSQNEVSETIEKAEAAVADLQPILAAIKQSEKQMVCSSGRSHRNGSLRTECPGQPHDSRSGTGVA